MAGGGEHLLSPHLLQTSAAPITHQESFSELPSAGHCDSTHQHRGSPGYIRTYVCMYNVTVHVMHNYSTHNVSFIGTMYVCVGVTGEH